MSSALNQSQLSLKIQYASAEQSIGNLSPVERDISSFALLFMALFFLIMKTTFVSLLSHPWSAHENTAHQKHIKFIQYTLAAG